MKKIGNFVFLLALSAGYIGGQMSCNQPAFAGNSKVVYDEVKAKKFVVIDDKGRTRGGFSYEGGIVGLTLVNANGEPKCTINIEQDGPGIMLLGKNGKMKCALKVIEDTSSLYFFDANGKAILKIP